MKEINNVQISLNDKTYQMNIIKVAQEFCYPYKKHECLTREYHSLHFVLDGCGTLCVGNKKLMLGRGTAFLLYGGEQYEYFPDSVNPWSYIWVNFTEVKNAEKLDALFEQCGLTKKHPYVNFSDYTQIANFFMQLHNSYDGGFLQNIKCEAYFSLILAQLIAEKNKYAPVGVRVSWGFKCFSDIVTYINSNYRVNLTIKQIADDMNVTEKQVYSLFRKYANITPINYINRFRISNACIFFQQMDVSVEEASKMVGIENTKYFTRLFSKWKDVSPREYRKNCNGEDPFYWLKEKNINYK